MFDIISNHSLKTLDELCKFIYNYKNDIIILSEKDYRSKFRKLFLQINKDHLDFKDSDIQKKLNFISRYK